ncbi:MAG: LamG domain-containing protein, partial [Lentisphaerae bacterium]|nr:LamG domain-containing protein [Lentisphaerota bacterium]
MKGIQTTTLLAVFLVGVVSCPAAGEALKLTWGDKGPASLQYDDRESLESGEIRVTGVFFQDAKGHVYEGDTEQKDVKVDPRRGRVRKTYEWGTVAVSYEPEGARLDLTAEISIHPARDTLVAIYLELMELRFASKPRCKGRSFHFYGGKTSMAHNVGGPGLVVADDGARALVFCIEDMARPLSFGLGKAAGKDSPSVFPVLAYTGRHPMLKQKWPFIDRPVNPGATETFRMSIRFGPTGLHPDALTTDLYKAYGKAHPSLLNWPDRRPIGRIIMCTSAMGIEGNPRGWFNDRSLDIRTGEARAAFRQRVLSYADNAVAICKAMNAQGVLVWDIEGQEKKHPISYLGDPRVLPEAAPEMEAVADAFFKKFSDAGLLTGITIRPTRVVAAGEGDTAAGKIGNALKCDGVGSFVKAGHWPDLEPDHLTIEAWVYADKFPAEGDKRRWIVSKNKNEHKDGHYALIVSGKRACAFLNIGGGGENCYSATSPKGAFGLGRWHHLAMSYDGAVLKTYVDGAVVASKTVNKPRSKGKESLNIG